MKPVLVFYEKNKDSKIVLSKDELRTLVEDAYNRGFRDGESSIPRPQKVEIPRFHRLEITC